ncbi:ATP-binding protein [Breoghania sp. L-A4]|uniref:ATP-binding protein n=1 Tax=Breoghania sp. L-A4 TaxID=2304600 RepID=UPI0020BE09F4|nr:ATP-binding protein [Breoghania sp. L-A4]
MLKHTVDGNVGVETRGAGETGCALVDPAQLESAILNLVINARDAMPGGGTVIVETSHVDVTEGDEDYRAVPPGSYVMVSVSDSGTGIAPAELERVFEPFFTTKDVGSGTGLGLSMVYGFVKQSGGHIVIASQPGEGTTVRLYFPRTQAEGPVAAQPHPTQKNPGGNERIFVVEDNDMVRSTVTAQLLALGYTVVEAASGADALKVLAEDRNFDLLFTDVAMPGGVNGAQLASRARQIVPALPVLFTSGYADSALLDNSDWSEDAPMLSKPHRFSDLARKVRDVLDARAG